MADQRPGADDVQFQNSYGRRDAPIITLPSNEVEALGAGSLGTNRCNTLVFDLYGTLVDPVSVSAALGTSMSPKHAVRVARLWRRKQIEYSFRLTLMETYQSFEWITARSLDFALLAAGQEMSAQCRAEVLRKYDSPEPFADVVPGLQLLEGAGYDIYVLSNGSPDMLRRCLLNSGLVEYVTAWVSVDDVGVFKPVPDVYRHAGTIFGRPMDELRLVSCNSFDVVGAQVAGMSTAWVNRTGEPFDTIGDPPDLVVSSIFDLADVLVR